MTDLSDQQIDGLLVAAGGGVDQIADEPGPNRGAAVVGLNLLENEDDDGAREVLGDSAYGTGNMRMELSRRGYTAIIKPFPLRLAVADGFTLDDCRRARRGRARRCRM